MLDEIWGIHPFGRLSAGNPSSTPPNLPSLWGWWDFSNASTLFQNSVRTVPVNADGDPVGGVTDISGNGRHLAQTTDAKRPLYKTGIRNGLSALLFNGTTNNFVLASTAVPANWTVFVVGVVAVTGTRHMINFDGSPRIAQIRSDNTTTFRVIGFDSLGVDFQDTQAMVAGAHHVFTAIRRTADVQAYVDGASSGATATLLTNASGTLAPAVGSNLASDAEFFSGHMDELIVCSTDLSSVNFDVILSYLRAKWSI